MAGSAAGGIVINPGDKSDPYGKGIGPSTSPPITSYGAPSNYTAAANTQASDYDRIMAQYADLAKSFSSNPLKFNPVSSSSVNPITPQTAPYRQSDDVTKSIGNLGELSRTGGYSDKDIQDIRERDISPIRSIYANARQNTERQRSLSGGYSPNFNAVTAKMARDEAQQIGDTTTAANAGIAQNRASNRISASSPYASASSSANSQQAEADRKNADIINQINSMNASIGENNANRSTQVGMFNSQGFMDASKYNRSGALGALQGQVSLYGTTPALTSTFGNQVAQAAQLSQGQQQLNNEKRRVIIAGAQT